MKAPPDDSTTEVPWRGGARARVAHGPYQWILDNVPEAATPEVRADLYETGARLRALLAAGDFTIPRGPTPRGRRQHDAAVVKAWDALMAAMAEHPNYRADHAKACLREGVDIGEASRYTAALRGVIDAYRQRPVTRRGGTRGGGRLPGTHRAWMAETANWLQSLLGVTESRASEIVADLVRYLGFAATAGSIRDAMRKRRL